MRLLKRRLKGLLPGAKRVRFEQKVAEFYAQRQVFEDGLYAKYGQMELLPCPTCGAPGKYDHDDSGMPTDSVHCTSCNLEVERCKAPDWVIRLWNALPREGIEQEPTCTWCGAALPNGTTKCDSCGFSPEEDAE